MAQEEIINLLKKNPGVKFDIPTIVNLSSISRKSVNRAVMQLHHYKEINSEIIKEKNYKKRLIWL